MENTNDFQKWVLTEEDFETLSWHDSRIHAIAFGPEKSEIVFDIDYIFEWIHPTQGQLNFSFRVAPATLVFENVYAVEFDLDLDCGDGGLEIDSIRRELEGAPRNAKYIGKDKEWLWTIECQQGDIKFRAAGFQMYARARPQIVQTQNVMRKVSFERGEVPAI